jgi:hypothetical protein
LLVGGERGGGGWGLHLTNDAVKRLCDCNP